MYDGSIFMNLKIITMKNIKSKIKWIFGILPFNLHISFDFYLYWKYGGGWTAKPAQPAALFVRSLVPFFVYNDVRSKFSFCDRAFTMLSAYIKILVGEGNGRNRTTLKIQRTWITIAYFVLFEHSIKNLFM